MRNSQSELVHGCSDRVGGPGPGEGAGGRGHFIVALAVVENGGPREECLSVEGRVLHKSRGPGTDHLFCIAALVPGRVRIRHHDHRQPEGRHFRQR